MSHYHAQVCRAYLYPMPLVGQAKGQITAITCGDFPGICQPMYDWIAARAGRKAGLSARMTMGFKLLLLVQEWKS